MVNTFILTADYNVSASHLDNTRIWKQVLEAWQILRVLEQAHSICVWERWSPCPVTIDSMVNPAIMAENYLARCTWLSDVRSRYLRLNYRYVIINGLIQIRSPNDVPFRADAKTYQVCGDHVHILIHNAKLESVRSKILPPEYNMCSTLSQARHRVRTLVTLRRSDVSLGDDRIFNMGYAAHPAVAMWIGYEPSLVNYIHAHLFECLKRGINAAALPLPTIVGEVIIPWWITQTEAVFYTHRASLYRKDPKEYAKFLPYIPNQNVDYLWPSKMSLSDIVNVLSKTPSIEIVS